MQAKRWQEAMLMSPNAQHNTQHATEGVRPRILIIGAGLSGMATGAYLQNEWL